MYCMYTHTHAHTHAHVHTHAHTHICIHTHALDIVRTHLEVTNVYYGSRKYLVRENFSPTTGACSSNTSQGRLVAAVLCISTTFTSCGAL